MRKHKIRKITYLNDDDYALVSYLGQVLKISDSSAIRFCIKLVRDWCTNNRLNF